MSDTDFHRALTALRDAWDAREKEFQEQLERLELTSSQSSREAQEWKQKFEEAQAKLDHIQEQLEKATREYEDLAKNVKADALRMLDLYLLLLEQVFSASSHMRLLLVLHGDKETYTLEELAKATGINKLEVRQAVFAMRNVGVVEFNDETHEVKLLQRLF